MLLTREVLWLSMLCAIISFSLFGLSKFRFPKKKFFRKFAYSNVHSSLNLITKKNFLSLSYNFMIIIFLYIKKKMLMMAWLLVLDACWCSVVKRTPVATMWLCWFDELRFSVSHFGCPFYCFLKRSWHFFAIVSGQLKVYVLLACWRYVMLVIFVNICLHCCCIYTLFMSF